MTLKQNINKYWNFLERKYKAPLYVRKINELKFENLKKAVDEKNEKYLKQLIKKMYVNKEAFIFCSLSSNILKLISFLTIQGS